MSWSAQGRVERNYRGMSRQGPGLRGPNRGVEVMMGMNKARSASPFVSKPPSLLSEASILRQLGRMPWKSEQPPSKRMKDSVTSQWAQSIPRMLQSSRISGPGPIALPTASAMITAISTQTAPHHGAQLAPPVPPPHSLITCSAAGGATALNQQFLSLLPSLLQIQQPLPQAQGLGINVGAQHIPQPHQSQPQTSPLFPQAVTLSAPTVQPALLPVSVAPSGTSLLQTGPTLAVPMQVPSSAGLLPLPSMSAFPIVSQAAHPGIAMGPVAFSLASNVPQPHQMQHQPNPHTQVQTQLQLQPQSQSQFQLQSQIQAQLQLQQCAPMQTPAVAETNITMNGMSSDGGDQKLRVVGNGEYEYIDCSHPNELLKELNRQRLAGEFTDVTLSVQGGHSLDAHRNVLSSCSPFFKEMIKSGLDEVGGDSTVKLELFIPDVSQEAMELLLGFVYTGSLMLNATNTKPLLEAASKFQCHNFCQVCSSFFEKQISVRNCLGIQSLAKAMSCPELEETARIFALQHFPEVCTSDEILHLNKNELVSYLSSDDLNARVEEPVYEVAIRWLRHENGRMKFSADVVSSVRLPFIHPSYLFDTVDKDEIVRSAETCRELVNEAKRYHMLPHARQEMQTPQTRPRTVAGMVEVIVVVGGRHFDTSSQRNLTAVSCHRPQDTRWFPLASLPFFDREFYSVVASGDNMYLTGGMEGGLILSDIWCYSSLADRWNLALRMALPRCRHNNIALDGKIYALGGLGVAGNLNHAERFDTVTSQREDIAMLPRAVHSAAAATYGGRIYLFGGVNESGRSACIMQSYLPHCNTWSYIETPMIDNKNTPAVVVGDLIYILGGTYARATTIYDPKKENIKSGPDMNYSRQFCGAVVHDGKVYVMGGLAHPEGPALATTEMFDPSTNTWTLHHDLPCAVYRHGCGIIRKSLPSS
uniref:kelch-like protein 29 n=1 Tax=Myxine glutinosa TaxID=7769 RepID=UPI00358DF8EC